MYICSKYDKQWGPRERKQNAARRRELSDTKNDSTRFQMFLARGRNVDFYISRNEDKYMKILAAENIKIMHLE